MQIAGILHESIVDGPGVRFVVFAQGCPHHCKGCHNQSTWDPNDGYEMSVRAIIKEVRKAPDSVKGVTLSGGEPFSQAGEMTILANRIHSLGLSVVTYTGYLYEDLMEMSKTDSDVLGLLEETDILVDGPFVENLKDISLRFCGSSNQRVIDMKTTNMTGVVSIYSVR
ncbi:MAG: anaerobic ribonucleoside-triphosphate reductase activating protein [Oscillospiraceae bacterium]|nr:anaerobic ribonucleoside-triphosphate reductase activating protein [Oscillospiraceae bacterium]